LVAKPDHGVLTLKKIKIDGTEYTLVPIPLHLAPFSSRIGHLLQQEPKSVEEATKNSDEILMLQKRLLEDTINPPISAEHEEHALQLYNVLVDLTNETIAKAQSFRQNPRPDVEKSGADGAGPRQATERDPGAQG
jgi:hypothetical protein